MLKGVLPFLFAFTFSIAASAGILCEPCGQDWHCSETLDADIYVWWKSSGPALIIQDPYFADQATVDCTSSGTVSLRVTLYANGAELLTHGKNVACGMSA